MLFFQEHMKVTPPSLICRAGDTINIPVSKTTSQVGGYQTIHQMTNNLTETQEWGNRLHSTITQKP